MKLIKASHYLLATPNGPSVPYVRLLYRTGSTTIHRSILFSRLQGWLCTLPQNSDEDPVPLSHIQAPR